MKEFKEIKTFYCWECEHPLNVSTSDSDGKRPHYRTGDIAMCGYCGAIHVVDAKLDAIKPPDGYLQFLERMSPEKYKKLMDLQRMTRDKHAKRDNNSDSR